MTLSNTATALLECVRSNAPVLLITGDTAPNNTLNQQTLEQEPFVRAAGEQQPLRPVALVDEGVNETLDILQERAHVNALLLANPTWTRGTGGRQVPGQPFPDHGKQQPDRHRAPVSRC